jgi:hypothetical protein
MNDTALGGLFFIFGTQFDKSRSNQSPEFNYLKINFTTHVVLQYQYRMFGKKAHFGS